ncbi:hypothetical protein BDF14DRAFT_1730045, partial [Spinellus fusiger]
HYDTQMLLLRGVPKALLPISGVPALSWWYKKALGLFENIYVVCNAYNTSVLQAIALVSRVKNIQHELIVTIPEYLYDERSSSEFIDTIVHKHGDYRVSYSTDDVFNASFSTVAFSISNSTLRHLDESIKEQRIVPSFATLSLDGLEKELLILLSSQNSVENIQLDFSSISQFMSPGLSLESYQHHWAGYFDALKKNLAPDYTTQPIQKRSYARVGLMGNPSDGFYGKTMSLLISNFWAEVVLVPNSPLQPDVGRISFMTHLLADTRSFISASCLVSMCENDGYDHGDRLLLSCFKVFFQHCKENKIEVDTRQGFTAFYETNIPRQVGLAGSSAIITAFWKSLLQFYGVSDQQIPIELQATLVMMAELELGVSAGLQDRVIQAYGGLVSMDFEETHMKIHKYGKYTLLDHKTLPPLWLAYLANPEESGKVHSTVKQRFMAGDPVVVKGMRGFAALTDKAEKCLRDKDFCGFAQLMTDNFELRRSIYGEEVLGAANLRMIALARQNKCAAKFSGSGGAVVCMWSGMSENSEEQDTLKLRQDLEVEGFVFVKLVPMGRQFVH